ncbi:hypothetical protein GS506_08715 [Rhodococcus hoagii]|nr:hypothetical protein [Prescottella equi]
MTPSLRVDVSCVRVAPAPEPARTALHNLHTRSAFDRYRLSTLTNGTGRCCLPWVGAV